MRTKRQQTATSLAARSLAFLERRSLAISLALVLIASIRIVTTYTVFNRTSDEPAHIACGMEWLDKGVYRWEPQHPPLARVAAALGPYLLGIRSQGTVKRSLFSMTYEGIAILDRDHHEDLTLALARLGILPFFWIACLVVYAWGKRYFGAAVGALAVFLFSFLPPVLAHAGLATTDMALTAFLGAAFLSGLVWTEQPTRAHALWFGAATGLAVLSKFSCLAFLPASVVVGLAWYVFAERPKMAWLARAVKERLPSFGLAVLAACLLIWAGYRFSFGGGLPAPELYSGIRTVITHNAEGHPGYLLGQRSETGWWYFFEVALAVKTPLAFLILLGFGVAPALRRQPRYRRPFPNIGNAAESVGQTPWSARVPLDPLFARRVRPFDDRDRPTRASAADQGVRPTIHAGERSWEKFAALPWLPLAFAGGILLVGVFSRINIGLRHVLPVYIGFAVLAAAAVVRLLELAERRKWVRIGVALLVVWLAGSSLMSHPDYLAYFNELGGSEPEKILVDSDLDWGQDLKRLATRLHEVGAREVAFLPLTLGDIEHEMGLPPIQGMDVQRPSQGWNAVGVTCWRELRLGLGDRHPEAALWPDRIQPTERVGKSMLLYYVP